MGKEDKGLYVLSLLTVVAMLSYGFYIVLS